MVKKDLIRLKTTMYLYAQGYLSFGKARKLAALSKWELAERLGVRGIPRHYTEQDLEEDLRFAIGGNDVNVDH